MGNKLDDLAIYVVSLKHARARRKKIQQQLDRCGLTFKFIDATDDRKELSAEEYELLGTKDLTAYRDRLAPGALGCLLSHLRIHEEIINSSLPYALILEDDAELSPDFREVLLAILASPAKWNMLHLGWRTAQPLPYFGKSSFPLNLLKRQRLQLNNSTAYYIGPVVATIFCTHGYLIRHAACEYLLAGHKKFILSYDVLLNLSGLSGRYALTPRIATQNVGDGDISYGRKRRQDKQQSGKDDWQKDNGFSGLLYATAAKAYGITPRWLSRLTYTIAVLTLTKPLGYYKYCVAKLLTRDS